MREDFAIGRGVPGQQTHSHRAKASATSVRGFPFDGRYQSGTPLTAASTWRGGGEIECLGNVAGLVRRLDQPADRLLVAAPARPGDAKPLPRKVLPLVEEDAHFLVVRQVPTCSLMNA